MTEEVSKLLFEWRRHSPLKGKPSRRLVPQRCSNKPIGSLECSIDRPKNSGGLMRALMQRRQFLQTAGAAALVGAGKSISKESKPDPAAPLPASAPRLLSGCCAYSFRKALASKQMTMEDFILKGVEMGLEGVDMTVYWLKSTDPGYLAGLRHLALKNGIPFSGAACGSSMVQADKAKRDKVLDDIKKWIDVTDALGASHLRVFGGDLPSGATEEQAIGWIVETMKTACEYSGKKGITLALKTTAELLRPQKFALKSCAGWIHLTPASTWTSRTLYPVPARMATRKSKPASLMPPTLTSARSLTTSSPSTLTAFGGCLPRPDIRVICRRSLRARKTPRPESRNWSTRSKHCAENTQRFNSRFHPRHNLRGGGRERHQFQKEEVLLCPIVENLSLGFWGVRRRLRREVFFHPAECWARMTASASA